MINVIGSRQMEIDHTIPTKQKFRRQLGSISKIV